MVDKKSTFSQLKVHLVTFIVKVFSVDWISKRLLNISFWFGFPFKRSFVAVMDASIVDLSFQLSFSYPIQLKGGGLRGIFARGRGGGLNTGRVRWSLTETGDVILVGGGGEGGGGRLESLEEEELLDEEDVEKEGKEEEENGIGRNRTE